jgi:hypothetical protein
VEEQKFTTVEVHRVKNGWMVHPTRGWLDQDIGDDRIWVFNKLAELFAWIDNTMRGEE